MTAKALHEVAARQNYEKALMDVEVVAPLSSPDIGQESLEIGLVMYSIQRDSNVEGPEFDPQLNDRGLTTGGVILPQKRVTIGAAAYTSWGVLGSTLAHEIEVHVPQSFLKVVAVDSFKQWSLSARRFLAKVFPAVQPSPKEMFENDGTLSAERDAYMHEIRNSKRFGLTQEELRSIWRVMDFYYPIRNSAESSHFSAASQPNTESENAVSPKASDL